MERKTREKRKREKKVEEISQDEKEKIREEEMEVKYLQAELLVFTLLPCFGSCVAYMSRKGKLGMAMWRKDFSF